MENFVLYNNKINEERLRNFAMVIYYNYASWRDGKETKKGAGATKQKQKKKRIPK
jgi:hypothetical protein